MNPEALILRRCYPVPVTFADLRAAYWGVPVDPPRKFLRAWHHMLKQVTSAIDEVYAVVDGREVRVAVVDGPNVAPMKVAGLVPFYDDLLDKADREGYWERPHEVRLDLSPRPVSHGEVAQAVLVGQEALERGGVVRT